MNANAASSQTLANNAPDPSLIQFAVESLTCGPKSNESSKKRSHQSQNGNVNIEDAHCSLDNLKQIENALHAVKDYLEKTSDGTTNKLPVEVLAWSIDELSKERTWIEKMNCTTLSRQVHAKLTKEQRQQAANLNIYESRRGQRESVWHKKQE